MPPKIDWEKILLNKFVNIEDIISINDISYNEVDKKLILQKDKIKYKCQNEECDEINEKTIQNLKISGSYCKKCTHNNKKRYNKFNNINWNKKLLEIFRNRKNIISINNIPFNKFKDHINNKMKLKYICKNNECNEINEKLICNIISNGCYCKKCTKKYRLDKLINTNLDKYGTEHAIQNQEVFSKHQKSSFSKKNYILPDNTIIEIQGFENFALDKLLYELNYNQDDLMIGCNQEKPFNYSYLFDDNGTTKTKIHWPDIFIISEKKIIEVKSQWTYYNHEDKNIAKWMGALDLGFKFEFWLFDNKGNNIEIIA